MNHRIDLPEGIVEVDDVDRARRVQLSPLNRSRLAGHSQYPCQRGVTFPRPYNFGIVDFRELIPTAASTISRKLISSPFQVAEVSSLLELGAVHVGW